MTVSPVRGLRAVPAARFTGTKLPKPTRRTSLLDFSEAVIRAVLAEDPALLGEEEREQYEDALDKVLLRQKGRVEHLRLAIRLQQMDMLYHEVGGMYDQLAASGHLQAVVSTPEDVEKFFAEERVRWKRAVDVAKLQKL